jgi:hypothetical protein
LSGCSRFVSFQDREDRELRSFELKIQVEPDYHPKIIGRRGAIINKIRANHGVQISFPRKEDASEDQSTIKIQGYETAAKAARDEILKIVGDFNEMVKETVPLRIHSRIIGQRGRHVRQGDADMNQVTVMGKEEDVEACKDHLLNLEEVSLSGASQQFQDVHGSWSFQEYMQDVIEPPKQSAWVTYENLFESAMKNNLWPPREDFQPSIEEYVELKRREREGLIVENFTKPTSWVDIEEDDANELLIRQVAKRQKLDETEVTVTQQQDLEHVHFLSFANLSQLRCWNQAY